MISEEVEEQVKETTRNLINALTGKLLEIEELVGQEMNLEFEAELYDGRTIIVHLKSIDRGVKQ